MTPQSTSSSTIWIKNKASSKLTSNWGNSRAACRQTQQGLSSDRGASRESAVQIFYPSKVFGDGAVQGVALTADGDAVGAVLNIRANMDGSTRIVRHHHRGPDVKMLVRGMSVARGRPGCVDQPGHHHRVDSHPFPGGIRIKSAGDLVMLLETVLRCGSSAILRKYLESGTAGR
jgi:hypothetical protein